MPGPIALGDFTREEVEEIQVADARVYAGRELHASLVALPSAWPSDLLQVAYAVLIEAATGEKIV